MYEKFYSPNILAVASSLVGEDSLSVSPILFIQFDLEILNLFVFQDLVKISGEIRFLRVRNSEVGLKLL